MCNCPARTIRTRHETITNAKKRIDANPGRKSIAFQNVEGSAALPVWIGGENELPATGNTTMTAGVRVSQYEWSPVFETTGAMEIVGETTDPVRVAIVEEFDA